MVGLAEEALLPSGVLCASGGGPGLELPPTGPSKGCGDPGSQPPLSRQVRKQQSGPARDEVTVLSGCSSGGVAHTWRGSERGSALLTPVEGCRPPLLLMGFWAPVCEMAIPGCLPNELPVENQVSAGQGGLKGTVPVGLPVYLTTRHLHHTCTRGQEERVESKQLFSDKKQPQ